MNAIGALGRLVIVPIHAMEVRLEKCSVNVTYPLQCKSERRVTTVYAMILVLNLYELAIAVHKIAQF